MASDSTPRYQFPFPRLTGQEPSVPVDNEGLAVAMEASLSLTDDAAAVESARITQNELDIADLATIGGDFPAGIINMYGGQTPPGGWLFCDGSSKSTATYADLFAAIGYGFGGSGSAFNVPDMRTRVPVGTSSGVVPGVTGGAATHALTENELPVHNHKYDHSHTGVTNTTGEHTHKTQDGGSTNLYGNRTTYGQLDENLKTAGMEPKGDHSHSITTNNTNSVHTDNTGGNAAHSLMQPYTVVNYIIRH